MHLAQLNPQERAAAEQVVNMASSKFHGWVWQQTVKPRKPVAHLAGPEPCQGSAEGIKSPPPPLVLAPPALMPADLMRYERPPGPGSADGGAGIGAAGLNGLLVLSLSFALLGVPGLLLFSVTTAMLSLVCARPPICRRSMRFCMLQVHQCSVPGL